MCVVLSVRMIGFFLVVSVIWILVGDVGWVVVCWVDVFLVSSIRIGVKSVNCLNIVL